MRDQQRLGDLGTAFSAQTGAQTLAQKGIAGGLHFCLQVDGNDLIAVLEAMRIATERARKRPGHQRCWSSSPIA